MRILVLALLASLAAAGCIGPLQDPNGANANGSATHASGGGAMTAQESRSDAVAPCADGPFCAVRTVTVTGEISGIPTLDVTLSTTNGHVALASGSEGRWSFVATLRARGTTEAEAKQNLDAIQFSWSHQRGDAHFLAATAKEEGQSHGSVDFDVSMPPSLAWALVASTTNGAIDAKGIRTDGLSARSVNGAVTVDADVTQVDLGSTNGGVSATLRPTASGRIAASTTNGALTLRLPETPDRGYDLDARTTNGQVSVNLHDGEVGPCPTGSQYYTPPCNHRTFKTSGYDARAVRTSVALTTVNGAIDVASA